VPGWQLSNARLSENESRRACSPGLAHWLAEFGSEPPLQFSVLDADMLCLNSGCGDLICDARCRETWRAGWTRPSKQVRTSPTLLFKKPIPTQSQTPFAPAPSPACELPGPSRGRLRFRYPRPATPTSFSRTLSWKRPAGRSVPSNVGAGCGCMGSDRQWAPSRPEQGAGLEMPGLASNANFSPAWKPGEKIEELC
jgi:hypothetical protein